MKSVYYIPLFAILISCANDSSFESDGKKSTRLSNAADGTKAMSIDNAVAEEKSESAEIPGNITGAYLACSFSASNVEYTVACESTYELDSTEGTEHRWSYDFDSDLGLDFSISLDPTNSHLVRMTAPIQEDVSLEDLRQSMKIAVEVSKDGEVIHSDEMPLEQATVVATPELVGVITRPESARPAPNTCPDNWVYVRGDADYGTSDFCVMKYEAKRQGDRPVSRFDGLPWGDITQTEAIAACNRLDGLTTNYRLITNPQYMTLAAQIAERGSNWSSGTPGVGSLNRGHSDGLPSRALEANSSDMESCFLTGQSCDPMSWHLQRRTHTLSSGEVIWDFSGNVWEWTRKIEPTGKALPAANVWIEFPAVIDGANITRRMLLPTTKPFYNMTLTSLNGIGQYYGGNEGMGGSLRRGGSYQFAAGSGIYTAALLEDAFSRLPWVGFRCVMDLTP